MCLDLYATLDRDCCRTCDAQPKSRLPATGNTKDKAWHTWHRIVHCLQQQRQQQTYSSVWLTVSTHSARQGPHCGLRVLSTISLFQDSGPNTGRAERPSEILQLANLGVGHRMQRRKQHTNTNTQRQRRTTNNANDMAPGPDVPELMCSQLGGPHGISASHRAPLTHRTPDARRGTKVTRLPGHQGCHGRLALRAQARRMPRPLIRPAENRSDKSWPAMCLPHPLIGRGALVRPVTTPDLV